MAMQHCMRQDELLAQGSQTFGQIGMVTNISTPDCNFITAIANSTSVGERIVMANDGGWLYPYIGLDCVSVMV